jgi:hypothetical protein
MSLLRGGKLKVAPVPSGGFLKRGAITGKIVEPAISPTRRDGGYCLVISALTCALASPRGIDSGISKTTFTIFPG